MSKVSGNTNALDLSDEDFIKLNFDDFPEDMTSEVKKEETEEVSDEVIEETEEVSTDEKNDSEEKETEDTSETEESESVEEVEEESDTEVEDKEVTDPEEEDKEKTTSEINYEEAYKKILSPFKANGKEIKVDNVEDAIALMQMGANYNKKMAGLKPNLKLLKMLENNKLLDEKKLAYLIDLDKKNPAAITKLLKDSGVDPLDVDVKAPDNYKPNTYTVDDKEVDLDNVLDEIRDTASFNETLDIIGNKWDKASQKILVENPNIIKIINEHVESGAFQQIKQVVDSERMFGRLTGMSDLEAYKHVGDAINARGGFTKPSTNTLAQAVVKAKTKAVDPKLISRKKAASSTKSVASVKQEDDFNPLAMSDEDFEKTIRGKYI